MGPETETPRRLTEVVEDQAALEAIMDTPLSPEDQATLEAKRAELQDERRVASERSAAQMQALATQLALEEQLARQGEHWTQPKG